MGEKKSRHILQGVSEVLVIEALENVRKFL